jgi:hypothetical protein
MDGVTYIITISDHFTSKCSFHISLGTNNKYFYINIVLDFIDLGILVSIHIISPFYEVWGVTNNTNYQILQKSSMHKLVYD